LFSIEPEANLASVTAPVANSAVSTTPEPSDNDKATASLVIAAWPVASPEAVTENALFPILPNVTESLANWAESTPASLILRPEAPTVNVDPFKLIEAVTAVEPSKVPPFRPLPNNTDSSTCAETPVKPEPSPFYICGTNYYIVVC